MLGTIIGDIAGSLYEIEESKYFKTKNINYKNRMKILNEDTPLFEENSSYTDDTILTAAIANSLLTDKDYLQINYGVDLNFNLDELQKNYVFTPRSKDSIPQAIFCFLESNNFEDAIRKSISIGGDSDTIAAITGSIAEAYYGINKELIKEVENYLPEYIINITNEFYKTIGMEEPFKNEIKDFFKLEKIYSEDFFDFMKNKSKILPSETDLSWFGCFPVLENGILKDIKLIVPEIKTEKNLLVNIHEYTHAFQLFKQLGYKYIENVEKMEKEARDMEKRYLKRLI